MMYNDLTIKLAAWSTVNGNSYAHPFLPLILLILYLVLCCSCLQALHGGDAPMWRAGEAQDAAGGLKAPTEEELPTLQRSSTPGKVYIQLLQPTKRKEKLQRWQLKHSSRHPCTWLSSPQHSSWTSGNILILTVSALHSGNSGVNWCIN